MTKPQHQVRVTLKPGGEIFESPEGRLFFDDKLAKFTDLSGVRLLRCGVDTVRQLYNGLIRPEVMAIFDEPEEIVEFAGYQWAKGRIGRDSGYQYRLQNADMGLILLIKNHNVKLENIGPHLKIEVSPHALDGADPSILQGVLDDLAAGVLAACEVNQCAVHLALDVQGWTPSSDLVERMRCRSHRVRQINGIDRIEFDGSASMYGRGETFMFGSANGLQLCIYNKTLQARSTDKLDYWESVWATLNGDPFGDGEPAYNPLETVWRIEFRFHHSVVQQFAEGSRMASGEVIGCRTYSGLCPHLQGLWNYACDSFRLLLANPKWFDPFWSLITLDTKVQVEADPLIERTEYRRYYKTAQGFSGKNCEMFLGQFASLIARERVPPKKALEVGRTLPFWHVIEDHYTAKGYSTRDLERHVIGLINELSYLRAMFNCLIQFGEVEYPNPLTTLKPLKLQENELAYLDHHQIAALFATLGQMQHAHVELISTICLATGCRWGEAQGLVPSRVKGGAVHFINTKSKRRRSIPISPELENRILEHFKRHGPFTNCRNAFDEAVTKAGLELPPGQKAHVLRHTFASHFMANGGNILSLQKILGHSTLAMTMRYAHLAPGHMQDVLAFGPSRDFRHFFDTPPESATEAGEKAL